MGLLLILAGIASVFHPDIKASWSEALIAISAGAALLFLNDKPPGPTTNVSVSGDATINAEPGKASGLATAVFLASALIALSSCSTIRVPNSEDKASRIVAKNIRQNEAIFQAFPDIRTFKGEKIKLPEIVFETDTVYETVPDPGHLARIAELEQLLLAAGEPQIIEKWREYQAKKPFEYVDGTYTFNSNLFVSEVTLYRGQITNKVTAKEREVEVPRPIIKEVKKTSVFDWSLRIIVFGGLIFVVLLFIRRRGSL